MNPGKMDRKIRIERFIRVDDSGLGTREEWIELAKPWAQYLPQRGSEAREQLGREGQLRASFRIHWTPLMATLTTADRLRYPINDGEVWNIQAVTEIGRRDGLEIIAMAREGDTA